MKGVDFETDLSLKELRILLDMSYQGKKQYLAINSLAKDIGEDSRNPYFQKVLKFLRYNDAIQEEDSIANTKKLKINHKKIKTLIKYQNITQEMVRKFFFYQGYILKWDFIENE